MLAILEEPSIRERVPKFTVERYHRLFAAGGLARDLELIRGALVETMPKSPLHTSIVALLTRYLSAQLSSDWYARFEQPLSFAALDSEPEPDVAIVSGDIKDFIRDHPVCADLVIEVVVTSERLDRIKLGIYAEAGVPESWLILAEERRLERHTQPRAGAYTCLEQIDFSTSLASTVVPGLHLPPPELATF